MSGHLAVIKYSVIRLSEIDGQDIIDGGPSGLFPLNCWRSCTPLASLMKRPVGIDSEAWLRHCVDAANGLPVDESIKVDILERLMILSGLEYDSALINRILSQEGLMDAIMRESSFTQYIMKQGIERGERDRAIADIIEVLEIRFDLPETDPLSARIAVVTDLYHLKQLLRSAVQVSSLEAFQQILDEAD